MILALPTRVCFDRADGAGTVVEAGAEGAGTGSARWPRFVCNDRLRTAIVRVDVVVAHRLARRLLGWPSLQMMSVDYCTSGQEPEPQNSKLTNLADERRVVEDGVEVRVHRVAVLLQSIAIVCRSIYHNCYRTLKRS